MHLERPYLTTTNTRVRKAITGKPQTLTQRKHAQFIQSMTKGKKSSADEKNKAFRSAYSRDMKADQTAYVSHGIEGDSSSCIKKDIMTKRFKETPEVQKEIISKSKQVAPGWNKGNYIFITEGTDPQTLGRKV